MNAEVTFEFAPICRSIAVLRPIVSASATFALSATVGAEISMLNAWRVSARVDHCLGSESVQLPNGKSATESQWFVISTSPSKYAARLLPGSVPPASDVGAWADLRDYFRHPISSHWGSWRQGIGVESLLSPEKWLKPRLRSARWTPALNLKPLRFQRFHPVIVLNRDSVLTWSRIVGFNREILNHKTCFDSRMYRDVIHEHV